MRQLYLLFFIKKHHSGGYSGLLNPSLLLVPDVDVALAYSADPDHVELVRSTLKNPIVHTGKILA